MDEIKVTGYQSITKADAKPTDKVFRGDDGEMYSALELQALMSEAWSNNACLGYTILAMESLEFQEAKIKSIVRAMHMCFDAYTLSEADQHYCKGPY